MRLWLALALSAWSGAARAASFSEKTVPLLPGNSAPPVSALRLESGADLALPAGPLAPDIRLAAESLLLGGPVLALQDETHLALIPLDHQERPRAVLAPLAPAPEEKVKTVPLVGEIAVRLDGLAGMENYAAAGQALREVFDALRRGPSAVPDPEAALGELLSGEPDLPGMQGRLRSIFPEADIEFSLRKGYLYANRDKLGGAAETFYGKLYEHLSGRPEIVSRGLRVLDHNFSVAGDRTALMSGNIVDEAALGRGALYDQLSEADRERLLFEPFARKLSAAAPPLLFHIDHHYAPRVLATVSTTVLLTDFLRYLHKEGLLGLIDKLRSTFGVMDHSDADIALSQLVLRKGNDAAFLKAHGGLLKAAALFNDYGRETGVSVRERDQAKLLYDVAVAVEALIAGGRLSYDRGLDLLEYALENFVAPFEAPPGTRDAEAALYRQLEAAGGASWLPLKLFFVGAREYMLDAKVLEGMLREGLDGAALKRARPEALQPGTIRRVGSAIVVYFKDSDRSVGNSSVLRYLQANHPDLLNDARVLISTNLRSGSRLFQIRSYYGSGEKAGSFLNLADEDAGFYALLNRRPYRGDARYKSGGRHLGGGGGKGGFGLLSHDEITKVLKDMAEVSDEAVAAQFKAPPGRKE